jgi:hypothetical protein
MLGLWCRFYTHARAPQALLRLAGCVLIGGRDEWQIAERRYFREAEHTARSYTTQLSVTPNQESPWQTVDLSRTSAPCTTGHAAHSREPARAGSNAHTLVRTARLPDGLIGPTDNACRTGA